MTTTLHGPAVETTQGATTRIASPGRSDRAALIGLFPDSFSGATTWVIFGFLALGTVMNLISRSRKERAVMTPLAAVLAALALLAALS